MVGEGEGEVDEVAVGVGWNHCCIHEGTWSSHAIVSFSIINKLKACHTQCYESVIRPTLEFELKSISVENPFQRKLLFKKKCAA